MISLVNKELLQITKKDKQPNRNPAKDLNKTVYKEGVQRAVRPKGSKTSIHTCEKRSVCGNVTEMTSPSHCQASQGHVDKVWGRHMLPDSGTESSGTNTTEINLALLLWTVIW